MGWKRNSQQSSTVTTFPAKWKMWWQWLIIYMLQYRSPANPYRHMKHHEWVHKNKPWTSVCSCQRHTVKHKLDNVFQQSTSTKHCFFVLERCSPWAGYKFLWWFCLCVYHFLRPWAIYYFFFEILINNIIRARLLFNALEHYTWVDRLPLSLFKLIHRHISQINVNSEWIMI